MSRSELLSVDPTEQSLEKINGTFAGHDILSLDQFDRTSLDKVFARTQSVKETLEQDGLHPQTLQGNIVTLLFYEPSSRTRGSFDAATKRMGGNTIVVENPQQFSSAAKGESFKDTIRTFENYSDVIVLRHPQTGSAQIAADAAKIPIINAGDGGSGEHPTQALLDLFTIREKRTSLENMTGVVAGDLVNGRTVKSLIRGLALYPGNTLYLLSPEQLKLSRDDLNDFTKRGIKLIEIGREDEIPQNADFWYWTRVQKERFSNPNEYETLKNSFVLTRELLNRYGGENTIIMHPLPRVEEISEDVDDDSRAVYLRSQMKNGMYVRMALLGLVLGKKI